MGSAAGGWLYSQGGWSWASSFGLLMPILALTYDVIDKTIKIFNKKETLS
jgi:hypothetical protein